MRRRARISRGKRHVESDNDVEIDDEMEDVEPVREVRAEAPIETLTDAEVNLLRILLGMNIAGTRYPDRHTMERLGIADDVDAMLNNLGIREFMFRRHASYKNATCIFLATLELHPCSHGQFTRDGSDSYIHFWAAGKRRMLSFRDIDSVLYLPRSDRHGLTVDRNEMIALWQTIASGDWTSGSKSALIRSPSIRYLHKSLANLLYPRRRTGNVNARELEMIDVALTGILPRLANGEKLKGSSTTGGITQALMEQLLYYQGWARKNEGNKCELRMGGLITPLLLAVGFTPDETEEVAQPEAIDLNYLMNCHFLKRTPDGDPVLYQFDHLQFGLSEMVLPNIAWTTIRGGSNVSFNPPQSILRDDSASRGRYTTPLPSHAFVEQSQEQEDEPMDEFSNYHFPEFVPTRSQSAGLKVAHEHINMLQRWNKSQDKHRNTIADKCRRKFNKMANQIKALQNLLSCTSSARVRRRARHIAAPEQEPSDDEFEDDLTEDLQPPPTQQPPPDQARHSSYETHQRKRRAGEMCADTDQPLRRCSSTRQVPPPDQTTPQPSAPTSHPAPPTSGRASSSNIPRYTRESMDADIDALIYGRR